ncbi:MAG TPA: hypothetical protein GX707_04820 [Epulopiscium sp.]|nr:hypothetical protein [Candidatus Epulonipiscium sp.]
MKKYIYVLLAGIISIPLFGTTVFAEPAIIGYEYSFMQEISDRTDLAIVNGEVGEYIPFDTFTQGSDTYIAVQDLPRISEEFFVGWGYYEGEECEYIIYNNIGLNIHFYKNGNLKYMEKYNAGFSTQHIPILRDEKIYVPLKLIKEQLGYEIIIPPAPKEKEKKVVQPIVPVEGTKLGYIKVNGELCQVRYIKHSLDNLVNVHDYARYIPCLLSYDETTDTLEVRRGRFEYAEFQPGKVTYKYAGLERLLDPPVQRIGDDFYVAMHLLARIKKDIYNFTSDGKHISITTQEFMFRQRNAERLQYIEDHGQEAWDQEEKNRIFLGHNIIELGYDFWDWRDSLQMKPYNPDGTRLITNYTMPLPLDLSADSLTKTGEKLKMGPFTVPLYKGTIRYTSNPAFGKNFISEIRHPFGMMLTYYKENGSNRIELAIAENANIELVMKELYSVFAPEYSDQQVQAFIHKVFETGVLIRPEIEKGIEKQKMYITDWGPYIINTRKEPCYDRFKIGVR